MDNTKAFLNLEEFLNILCESQNIHVLKLKDMKSRFNEFKYYSEENPQGDINNISLSLWKNINKVEEDNLEEICSVHEFLLCEILKIHRVEERELNNVLKYIFPGNIFLQKRNYDGGEVQEDGVKLCVRKPEEDYFLYLFFGSYCSRWKEYKFFYRL